MPMFLHHSLFCAVLYTCLSLYLVQLAPIGRLTRTADEYDTKSDLVIGENIPIVNDKGLNLFEGDIMLSDDQSKANREKVKKQQDFKRSVDINGSVETTPLPSTATPQMGIYQTWPNARVPYRFDIMLNSRWRMIFAMAMDMIQEVTCIQFVQADPTDADYLLYQLSKRCMLLSYVGRHGGQQIITIADHCSSPGHVIHRLGHALGMWHEHSRPDRDNYIEIIYRNLDFSWYDIYFRKISLELFKSVPDVGYDIQSVMHYSPYAFASTVGIDRPTIRIKDNANLTELKCMNRLPMGQRRQLSYKDTIRLNHLYRCSENVTNSITEPPCIIPTSTTPSMSLGQPSTNMPTLSNTIPIVTPKPLSHRLKSGNVIALTIGEGSYGMKCVPSPGCTPVPCIRSSCTGVNNQFHIINLVSSAKKKIRSGSTVLLRSVNAPANWLDCSNPRNCIIGTCREDNVEDLTNSSYKSSCTSHQFQVFGVGRKNNKLLNVGHKLRFKDKNQQSYLSCNGKRCRLLERGICPTKQKFQAKSNGECQIEKFSVHKLAEF